MATSPYDPQNVKKPQGEMGTLDATLPVNGTPPAQGDPAYQPPGGSTPPATSPDPFGAMGGGFWTGQQWVPKDHPLAQQGGGGYQPAPAYGPSTQPGQNPNAPPPTQYTSTPNMQQVQRDQILGMMQQNPVPDANDPVIKAQTDAFGAGQMRAARQAKAEAAEKLAAEGMSGGANELAARAADERAGNAMGAFAADLTNREYVRRKQEIQDFMKMNAATIDADQARMLQRELAQLDAQIRREGFNVQSSLGNRELDVRSDLGNKGINNDLIRMLLQNKQFGQDLGFRIGATEADLNNSALRSLFGV